ncbi:hypothetical protein CKF54_00130 [Psittacicella hinzii]|uniref:Uncharacterized protein n=1 Tax=Psittacicella hinzii TaxID=2028575 RepID=A0A3A1YB42_9GAMM|nr:hypothetical protein CKF54_00130 [Psittacicella hinzii]
MLVLFGGITIVSILIFNPYYSGITYTTSYYYNQATWRTILTGLADLNFFSFGKFAYVITVFFTLMHIFFLFQRTRKGFSWLAWLGFIVASSITFSGIGIIYNAITYNPHLLFNIYDEGGFVANLISYFTSSRLMQLLIGVLITAAGVIAMYYTMIKRLVADYYAFLSTADYQQRDLESYQDSSISSSILDESERLQRERELEKNKYLRVFNLPPLTLKDKFNQQRQEVDGLASLINAYSNLASPSQAQQDTLEFLWRQYDLKYQELLQSQKAYSKTSLLTLLKRMVVSGYSPSITTLNLDSNGSQAPVAISSLIPQGQEENYFTLTHDFPEGYVHEQTLDIDNSAIINDINLSAEQSYPEQSYQEVSYQEQSYQEQIISDPIPPTSEDYSWEDQAEVAGQDSSALQVQAQEQSAPAVQAQEQSTQMQEQSAPTQAQNAQASQDNQISYNSQAPADSYEIRQAKLAAKKASLAGLQALKAKVQQKGSHK